VQVEQELDFGTLKEYELSDGGCVELNGTHDVTPSMKRSCHDDFINSCT
jgi:hypothetical protein